MAIRAVRFKFHGVVSLCSRQISSLDGRSVSPPAGGPAEQPGERGKVFGGTAHQVAIDHEDVLVVGCGDGLLQIRDIISPSIREIASRKMHLQLPFQFLGGSDVVRHQVFAETPGIRDRTRPAEFASLLQNLRLESGMRNPRSLRKAKNGHEGTRIVLIKFQVPAMLSGDS